MSSNELGIYIHIPFCMQKCYYCDFVSYSDMHENVERFVNALIEEIKYKKIQLEKNEQLENRKITTVYIGGGTPSVIDSKYIKKILKELRKNYNIVPEAEITIEVNPGTVTKEKLRDYNYAGINRISMGLQTTNNKLLKEIGRIHTYEKFLESYNMLKEEEFENINIDLMLGLPNQTLEDLKTSVDEVVKLNPGHISVYSLIVEDGTPMKKMIESGKLELPDEDMERRMYWYVKDVLEVKNYIHYEVSNFAQQGYESKHNLNCWNQIEYLGFGAAAHSYFNMERYSNTSNLLEYIENIEQNNIEQNKIIEEKQTIQSQEKEFMMLGLRKIDGITIREFTEKFKKNPLTLFEEEFKHLVKYNLVSIMGDRIKLTNKGLDLANLVWEEFV